jgi:hypothetical protein
MEYRYLLKKSMSVLFLIIWLDLKELEQSFFFFLIQEQGLLGERRMWLKTGSLGCWELGSSISKLMMHNLPCYVLPFVT